MTTVGDKVIDYLRKFGPTPDAKLAGALGHTHQTINQTCRALEKRALLRRTAGSDGIIANSLVVGAAAVADQQADAPAVAQAGECLSEDEVKRAVAVMLETQGFTVQVKWGRDRGIDIEATLGSARLVIEAKGEVERSAQQVNYFLGAIGELVQRMAEPTTRYGLALPDNKQYRGLVARLPLLARQTVCHFVYFVSRVDGQYVVEVDGDETLMQFGAGDA